MTIIQHVNTTTAGDPNTGSVTVTKPSGTTTNDVLLVVGASNEGAWDTLPSGFTQAAVSTDADTPNNFRAYVWYKVCGGSEPASYTFGSTTAAGAGAPMVVTMSCFRNVDTTNPIENIVTVAEGAVAEPANPATSFTQVNAGRLFFARCARSSTAIPTFTNGTSNWSEVADAGAFSGGSIRYGIGTYIHDYDVGAGGRSEPAITCGTTETDNAYFLGALRAIPESGSVSMTLGNVTAALAGYHRIDADVNMTLGNVTVDMTGAATPPEGPVDMTLPGVTMAFDGGIIHGSISMPLGITMDVSAAVNPIGGFSATLNSITMDSVAETRPFGRQVIVIEPEKRGILVIQDDPGHIPIYLFDTWTLEEDLMKFAATIGDGSSTSFVITHDAGTKDVLVGFYDLSTGEEVVPLVIHSDVNTVTAEFATPPAVNAYRAVVLWSSK